MEFWGGSDVQEFADVSGTWTYRFKPSEVAQLLYTAGLERQRLEQLRQSGVQTVTIRAKSGSCGPACHENLGAVYPIDEAPRLPFCDPACCCSYVAITSEHPE